MIMIKRNHEQEILKIFEQLEGMLKIENVNMDLYWNLLLKTEYINYYLDYKYDDKIKQMLDMGELKEKGVI